jgi:hypothetical protein
MISVSMKEPGSRATTVGIGSKKKIHTLPYPGSFAFRNLSTRLGFFACPR